MRTISDIDDIYWAFAELHNVGSIITGGEREETTLEDGRVVYLTGEEKRFLDAVNRLRQPKPITRDTLIENDVTADKVAEPISTLTLFTAVYGLRRQRLTGNARHDAPEYARKAVEKVDAKVREAVSAAMKSLKKYTGDLNDYQLTITTCHAIDEVWDALGDRFTRAVGRAAHRLMTNSVFTENDGAYDRFLQHFIHTHARSAVIDLSRAAYYYESFPFCHREVSSEYPERNEILNTDIKYGDRLGCQDAIAMQLNLLNMYRVHPGMARRFIGEPAAAKINRLLAGLPKDTPVILRDTVFREDIGKMYADHFAELNDSIVSGVKMAIGFLKDSPILMDGLDGVSRDYVLEQLETRTTLYVYVQMACLDECDFAYIIRDISSMREKDVGMRPLRDYPGAIIMKHVRLSMHDILFRMRAQAQINGRI